MKIKFPFEPNFIFEIRSKPRACPLRSMRSKWSGRRQQFHSVAWFRDTGIELGAARAPQR